MSDTTIVSLKTTLLSVPWRGGPPAAGIVDPTPRQFVVVEITTKGGLSGMGYCIFSAMVQPPSMPASGR